MSEKESKLGRIAWRDLTVDEVDASAQQAVELGGAVLDGAPRDGGSRLLRHSRPCRGGAGADHSLRRQR